MIVTRSASEAAGSGRTVATVGTFDGVHAGHRAIIARVVDRAREQVARSVVVTFDPHPRAVLNGATRQVGLLSTVRERASLMEPLGVDALLVVAFTKAFAAQSGERFVVDLLVRDLHVCNVVVGHDHHFGKGRQGGVDQLEGFGRQYGFGVEQVGARQVDGRKVSSSVVRAELEAGNIEAANRLLGYAYGATGTVVRGDRRGTLLGYPTANIDLDVPSKLMPPHGVYLVEAEVGPVRRYGLMSIGVRPTVAEGLNETREVYLLEWSGDLYGQEMTVRFLHRMREERRFASMEELVEQMKTDKANALRVLAERYSGNNDSQNEQSRRS